jgi:hypothetical protein
LHVRFARIGLGTLRDNPCRRERQDKGWKHSGIELANYGADARIVH